MKSTLAVLGSGAAAALLLYGLLAAVEPRLPAPEDPWLDGWLAAGLKTQFRSVEEDPSKRLIFVDGRELFKSPDFEAVTLRRYAVEGANVQVTRLPSATVLDEFSEGRHLDFRLTTKGGTVHACRAGRNLLLVSVKVKGFLLGDLKVSRSVVERMFDAFEAAARRWP